jgi:hypothetical protein
VVVGPWEVAILPLNLSSGFVYLQPAGSRIAGRRPGKARTRSAQTSHKSSRYGGLITHPGTRFGLLSLKDERDLRVDAEVLEEFWSARRSKIGASGGLAAWVWCQLLDCGRLRIGWRVNGSPAITELRHVRTAAEKREAEEIANRESCEDFGRFEPLFQQVQRELKDGTRSARPFVKDAGFLKADIEKGNLFILGSQVAYLAEISETFKAPNGEFDARSRVIYSNGTESNLLLRALQRALYKDAAGRRITDPVAGPLFTRAATAGNGE